MCVAEVQFYSNGCHTNTRGSMMETNFPKRKHLTWFCVAYLILFIGYGFIMFYSFRDTKYELTQNGLFGDMFGTFNAFFTGLAFMAVSLTIYLQVKDTETNKRLSHISQVENTFFNMLSVLHQIIDFSKKEINGGKSSSSKSGREYYQYTFAQFKKAYEKEVLPKKFSLFSKYVTSGLQNGLDPLTNTNDYQKDLERVLLWIKGTYETFHSDNDAVLGHYFRYVYNIVKYIIEAFPKDKELQDKYIGLLQAQMSNDELGLLFFNALSIHGRNGEGKQQFKEWLDEHKFFENIDKRCVFDADYTKFYPRTSFKFITQAQRKS